MDGDQSNQNEESIEIDKIIDDRQTQYDGAQVKFAVYKNPQNNEWQNVITQILVLSKDEPKSDEFFYDYGNFKVGKLMISFNGLNSLLKTLVKKKKLVLNVLPEIKMHDANFEKNNGFELKYLPSSGQIISVGWGANKYSYRGSTSQSYGVTGPLISPNCPAYPDSARAIQSLIGIGQNYGINFGEIMILLPNYKAKIDKVILQKDSLKILILRRFSKEEKLKVKAFIQYNEIESETQEIDPDTGFVIQLKTKPLYAYLCLLTEKGEVLDYRYIYAQALSRESGLTQKFSQDDYLEIIKQGENEATEFKKNVEQESKEQFLESVGSFSNSKGGIIFVGVDDNGKIKDVKEPEKVKERIQSFIKDWVEPTPQFEITLEKIGEQKILVVRIFEGSNKPYNSKDQGVFIRYGSTDRHASRHDLDELTKKQEFPYGMRGY